MNKTWAWLALIPFALVIGGYLLMPHWDSRQIRRAAYERYADLGETAKVREVVDANHAEVYDQCFRPGDRRTEANLDVDKYARLMDERVERALGGIAEKARVAASAARPQAPHESAATAAPGPISYRATPTPAHSIELRAVSAKRVPGNALESQIAGRAFRVEVDFVDELHDVILSGGYPTSVTVKCPGGGTAHPFLGAIENSPSKEKPPGPGVTRLAYSLFVLDSTAAEGSGMCEVVAQVSDMAGNVSNEQKAFIAMR